MATEDACVAQDLSDGKAVRLTGSAPCFDDATMEYIEDLAGSLPIAQRRRCMLLVLARDVDVSCGLDLSSPDAYAGLREGVEVYREHVRTMLEMAEMACARLAAAGDRLARSPARQDVAAGPG